MEFLDLNIVVNHAGWIGTPEIVVIILIVLLLFGGRKIPELMRGMGKGIKEFKEGIAEDTIKEEDAIVKEEKIKD